MANGTNVASVISVGSRRMATPRTSPMPARMETISTTFAATGLTKNDGASCGSGGRPGLWYESTLRTQRLCRRTAPRYAPDGSLAAAAPT